MRLTISLFCESVYLSSPFDWVDILHPYNPADEKDLLGDDEVLFDQYITMPRGKLLTLGFDLHFLAFLATQHFLLQVADLATILIVSFPSSKKQNGSIRSLCTLPYLISVDY